MALIRGGSSANRYYYNTDWLHMFLSIRLSVRIYVMLVGATCTELRRPIFIGFVAYVTGVYESQIV